MNHIKMNKLQTFNYTVFCGCALFLLSCTEDTTEEVFSSETIEITTLFDQDAFEDKKMEDLLIELRICDPVNQDSIPVGMTPCSPKYFAFYSYHNKRSLEDAFLLQVKKGVNNYPYRRLLIFAREKGLLVKVNGVNGYLVEKRTRSNGIDDLVVAVVDNIGGHYERYDILLRYENGKYHYVEALGDLHGTFEHDSELKKEATKQIGERIKEKQLLF